MYSHDIFAPLDLDEATHAFYPVRELMKAKLAITLGKTYRQEGALQWGYLTPPDDRGPEHVRLTQPSARPRPRARRANASRGAPHGRSPTRSGPTRPRSRPASAFRPR